MISVVVPLATVLLTLAGGWLVSTRVTDHWNQIQKRRDLDLASAQEFQRLYGEFFAVWKEWNAGHREHDLPPQSPDLVWRLYGRAASVEGGLESLLTKVAAEHVLSDMEVEALGALRQGFQCLRNVMQKDKALAWWASEVPDYLAFKDLSVFMSGLLARGRSRETPSPQAAAESFRRITSNRFETTWVAVARRLFPSGQ